MRNRTWNQHCKGEGGRAEEENLIFFQEFWQGLSERAIFAKVLQCLPKLAQVFSFVYLSTCRCRK